jgi:hypothetical protein
MRPTAESSTPEALISHKYLQDDDPGAIPVDIQLADVDG